MLIENKGTPARSKPETFADGAAVQFDMDFLSPLLRRMRAPVVRELIFHFRGDVTASGAHSGIDSLKILKRIKIRDRGGDIFDMPGSIARICEQIELGSIQLDPDDIADTVQDATHDVFLRVTFDVEKSHRGADYGLPLTHLLDGGEIEVTFGTPSTLTIASGQLRVYAIVHDERTREAKCRLVRKVTSLTATEDDYRVGGSLRYAFITSDLGNTAGATSLAAITEIDSRVFQYNDLDAEILRQEYRRLAHDRAAQDAFLAATPIAFPLIMPSKGQHVGKMPDLDSFDFKIGAVPASGRVVMCYVADRNVPLTSDWLGFATPADYAAALKQRGQVNVEGSTMRPIQNWDSRLVRRLPVRIPAAGAAKVPA